METIALHVIGNLGVILILGAYWLVSTGRVQSFSPKYQVLNLVGALVMVGYSMILVARAPVILNGVWSVIAATSLIRNADRTKGASS